MRRFLGFFISIIFSSFSVDGRGAEEENFGDPFDFARAMSAASESIPAFDGVWDVKLKSPTPPQTVFDDLKKKIEDPLYAKVRDKLVAEFERLSEPEISNEHRYSVRYRTPENVAFTVVESRSQSKFLELVLASRNKAYIVKPESRKVEILPPSLSDFLKMCRFCPLHYTRYYIEQGGFKPLKVIGDLETKIVEFSAEGRTGGKIVTHVNIEDFSVERVEVIEGNGEPSFLYIVESYHEEFPGVPSSFEAKRFKLNGDVLSHEKWENVSIVSPVDARQVNYDFVKGMTVIDRSNGSEVRFRSDEMVPAE